MNELKLPQNEKDDFAAGDCYPEEEEVICQLRGRARRPRPELLMGIGAALAAVLLLAVLVPSLPYMFRDEDPQTAK